MLISILAKTVAIDVRMPCFLAIAAGIVLLCTPGVAASPDAVASADAAHVSALAPSEEPPATGTDQE